MCVVTCDVYKKSVEERGVPVFHISSYPDSCPQALGGRVCVVLGEWRGHEGSLKAVDIDSYSAQVIIDTGPFFKLDKHKGSPGKERIVSFAVTHATYFLWPHAF